MATTEDPPFKLIGARLQWLRLFNQGFSQRGWALRHNFNVTQYNNWEVGVRQIPVEAATRLCDEYGVSLDYLYRGRKDALPETLRSAL